ncbi:type IV pili methyl-accepting chemotaxis transducer N-terminal domain-containing protein [Yoonia sp.]|uniref:type IV pili methyl-accepting chemotaxis transducer N-terminal domain-containing protein n=1 Tax=Yoonia sp. TaxID=2212373 RepID=UPI002DFA1449|nr:type IV pili methyl-accepting chemotaxis transducer N-terminal domain-containing protein [Yoonia sp.]
MRYSSLLASVFLTGAMIMPVSGLYADSSFQSAGSAQSIIQDTGVANRLAAAQVLLSWTQALPAAACHLHNQVNVGDAAELLAVGDAQVEEVLNALLEGDIFWGIETSETRRKTIAEIEQLRAAWAPAQQAARRLLETPTDKDAALTLAQAADDLRERTYQLATMLDAQYSSSAEIQARDIMFIQLAGRLVTLNQQMALQACLLWSEGMDQTIADELKQTIQAYNGTLSALSNGLPQMSILPPQTPGIADKLTEIGRIWVRNQPVLNLVAVDEEISEQQRFDLYYTLIDEKVVLLDLLYLYQDHSKVAF